MIGGLLSFSDNPVVQAITDDLMDPRRERVGRTR